MREIKFRIWCKWNLDDGTIKYQYGIYNPLNCEESMMKQTKLPLHIKEIYKVEQYTGSKDQDGVDIYEGDIVSFVVNNGWKVTQKGKVTWNKRRAAFDIGQRRFGGCNQKNIIGHIYEVK